VTDTAPKNAAATQAATPLSIDSIGPDTWAGLVLAIGGWPITPNNLANMETWMRAENYATTWTGTAGANNPLNNGLGSGGGDGTGSYPDLFTAAVYAVKGIQGGIFSTTCGGNTPGGIAQALAADAPFPVFSQAVIKSGWASGCYTNTLAKESSGSLSPAVSAAESQKNGATGPVKAGDQFTQQALGDPALLQQAAQAAATAGTTAENAAKAAVGWTAELGALLGDLLAPSWWQRVGMGTLGVFLFAVGLAGFVSTTKPGQAAKSDAGDAVKGAAKDAAMAAVVA